MSDPTASAPPAVVPSVVPTTLPPETLAPELRIALALEHNAQGITDLAQEVGDLRELVGPAMALQNAALTAQAAAWTTCRGVGTSAQVLLDTLAALFKGWWGGPLAVMLLALITALSLAWTGWGPVDVTRFVVDIVHAARGDALASPPPPEPSGD